MSHRGCPVPEGRALALAAPPCRAGVVRSSGAPGGFLRSQVRSPVPEPFADCPSVLVTVLQATWQPASSRMRPLHRETWMHARGHYM